MSTLKKKKLKKPQQKITTLETLRAYLGIQRGVDNWDGIVIPESYGADWAKTCGWASVLIEKTKKTSRRSMFSGGLSLGDKTTATLMGILQPIMYLTNSQGINSAKGYVLYVVSSSRYLIKGLEQSSPLWHSRMAKNRELWIAIYAAKRRGLVIRPRLVPKEKLKLQSLALEASQDIQAALVQRPILQTDLDRITPDKSNISEKKNEKD